MLKSKFLNPLVSLALLAACSPVGPVADAIHDPKVSPDIRVADCDGEPRNLPLQYRSTLKPRTGNMVPDDHWADLAETVPGGFAGILYRDGKPTLMLTHPEQAEAAKRALTADPTFRGFNIAGAQVEKARWDFAQLVDWYDFFTQQTSIWQTPGMVSGDKNEAINRIRFGIQTEAGRQELVSKLSALDVPCDLVRIGIDAPVQVL
jgi:hypothetical protein